MTLPYCPNCRNELEADHLGWICWQYRRSPDDVSSARRGDQHYASRDRAVYRGQREDTLCEHYNEPGVSTCEGCSAPKVDRKCRHACTNCRMELPKFDNLSAHCITIAGPSAAGKSHYIVALHEWWTDHLSALGATCLPAMGRDLSDRFNFLRKQVLNGSPLEASLKGEMISFSWRITASDDGRAGLLFTLPDVSGERTLDLYSLQENRHYHHCSGVILILDGDRVAVAHQVANPSKRDPRDHQRLITAMLGDMDDRLTPQERAQIPIAVCVNKVDMLMETDSRWADLMAANPNNHEEYFDYWGCDQRSKAIVELLKTRPATAAIVQTLRANFTHVMFFAVAAIGSSPQEDADGKPSIVFAPISVGDPFLWMLWHMGMVNTVQ